MFERMIKDLLQKYNGDFNWLPIATTNHYFVDEAIRELKDGHPLYGTVKCSIAKCESDDAVLYVLSDEKYAIIHLTYSKNKDVTYPRFILFESSEDALKYIETKYLEEYT